MSFQYTDNYVNRNRDSGEQERRRPQVEPEAEVTAHDHAEVVRAESSKKEYYKFAGVIGVIFLCATIMATVVGFDWAEWMRWFMGGFLVFFGSFKLIGYEMFITMFPMYDPIAKRFKYYAWGYPFLEIFLGALYCLNLVALPRDAITLFIFSVGAYGILKNLPRGGQIVHCACLGNVIKLPLSTVTLIENTSMAVMAFVMLVSSFLI
jgi:hypothetical protein